MIFSVGLQEKGYWNTMDVLQMFAFLMNFIQSDQVT